MAESRKEVEIPILCIGLERMALELVESHCRGAVITKINNSDDFGAAFEQWSDGIFAGIISGCELAGMTPIESAQALQNQCPQTLKFHVTCTPVNYEPKVLLKNGFTSTFMLPTDEKDFKRELTEKVMSQKMVRSYRTVRILDLEGGDSLDFQTYIFLPRNKKYIRFTGAGQVLDPGKIEKLQAKEMSQVFVDHKEMSKFYQYTAQKLRELGAGAMSTTESQEKLRTNVRALFTDIFDTSIKADFDNGKEMLKQTEGIISNYITQGVSSDWFQKLAATIGEGGDTYSHASNVATFASLFGIGLGFPKPEDLAMAGLFHDIGIAELPAELQSKREHELMPKEKTLYYSHVEKSVNMVKNKRIIVTADIEKMILQHHEMWNGKGWPKQLASHRITEGAQILSFADQFDELTRFEEGRARVLPLQAIDIIEKNGSIDPALIRSLRKLLIEKGVGAHQASA